MILRGCSLIPIRVKQTFDFHINYKSHSAFYNLAPKADAKNAGSSIKELVKCYEELENKDNKKDLANLLSLLQYYSISCVYVQSG